MRAEGWRAAGPQMTSLKIQSRVLPRSLDLPHLRRGRLAWSSRAPSVKNVRRESHGRRVLRQDGRLRETSRRLRVPLWRLSGSWPSCKSRLKRDWLPPSSAVTQEVDGVDRLATRAPDHPSAGPSAGQVVVEVTAKQSSSIPGDDAVAVVRQSVTRHGAGGVRARLARRSVRGAATDRSRRSFGCWRSRLSSAC